MLWGMNYRRSQLIDPHHPTVYHCISRCVRRAHLCGYDARSGRSFEHRRGWIEARLHHLSGVFAADVFAYAIMHNHVHVVVRMDPERVQGWSLQTVARRWLQVHPERFGRSQKLPGPHIAEGLDRATRPTVSARPTAADVPPATAQASAPSEALWPAHPA